MNDPRLNSIHLEDPRREEFRRARRQLLESRGQHTLNLEGRGQLPVGPQATIVHFEDDAPAPTNVDFWLRSQGSTYPLKVGVNTIGRLPDNDIVLEGAYVSRRHCAILVHAGDSCEVYDIASKNGTFVNGAKLDGPTRLSSGDQIRMCDREVVFMSRFHLDAPGNHDTSRRN
jgi:FHA domain